MAKGTKVPFARRIWAGKPCVRLPGKQLWRPVKLIRRHTLMAALKRLWRRICIEEGRRV